MTINFSRNEFSPIFYLMQSCIKVALEFVSPESVSSCLRLTKELRLLPFSHRFKEDKLEVWIFFDILQLVSVYPYSRCLRMLFGIYVSNLILILHLTTSCNAILFEQVKKMIIHAMRRAVDDLSGVISSQPRQPMKRFKSGRNLKRRNL